MVDSLSQQVFCLPLDLSAQQPLVVGGERFIYQHPAAPSLLVKVFDLQQYAQDQAKKPITQWHKRFRRSPYNGYVTELAEYIASQSQSSKNTALSVPLARVVGVVSLAGGGMGLLTEKITGPTGGLAPTLREVVQRNGLSPQLCVELATFFDTLAEAHVILNDLGPSNIVVGTNASGRSGLWLIDGFGNKQAIPIFALSKTWNRRRIMRKYGEMMVKLERIDRERRYAPPVLVSV